MRKHGLYFFFSLVHNVSVRICTSSTNLFYERANVFWRLLQQVHSFVEFLQRLSGPFAEWGSIAQRRFYNDITLNEDRWMRWHATVSNRNYATRLFNRFSQNCHFGVLVRCGFSHHPALNKIGCKFICSDIYLHKNHENIVKKTNRNSRKFLLFAKNASQSAIVVASTLGLPIAA